MAKKYYVIWQGAQTGVFDNWPQVQSLIAGQANAQYMGFTSKQEAEAAFADTYTKALMKRSLAKGGSSKAPSANSSSKANSSKKASTASKGDLFACDINIFTDGACSPNPGKAGTGLVIYQKKSLHSLWYGFYDANGTNNTAELLGLLQGLKLAEKYLTQVSSVQVLSDSKYGIDCITKWAAGWQKKGWKKADGQPIKNPEIIQPCFALYQKLKSKVTISHVKGHANIEGNELADRMAVYARTTQEKGFKQFEEEKDIVTILAMPSG